MRAVLDANILIAAVLSPSGAPGQLVSRWLEGDFELIVSEALLAEVTDVLASSKLRGRISAAEADAFEALLRGAGVVDDPESAPRRSSDPDDDYLLALAEAERAVLVSGDPHLLELADRFPVVTMRSFLDSLTS